MCNKAIKFNEKGKMENRRIGEWENWRMGKKDIRRKEGLEE
jgi:hypothetical protein